DNRARLMNPRDGEVLDVVLVDLGERTIAEAIVAAVVHRPVVGIVVQQTTQALGLAERERGRDEERRKDDDEPGATVGQPLPHKARSSRIDPGYGLVASCVAGL